MRKSFIIAFMVLAVALAAVITAYTLSRQAENNTDDPVATRAYASGEFSANVLANSLTPLESRMGAVYDSAVNTQKRMDPQENTKASAAEGRGTVINFKSGAWFQVKDGEVSIGNREGRTVDVSEGDALSDAEIEMNHRYVIGPDATLTLKVNRRTNVVMAGPVEVVPGQSDYVDLQTSDWYYDYVADVVELGIMDSTGDRTFSPNDPVSRISGVVMSCLISQLKNEGEITLRAADGEQWYQPYLDYAAEKGILSAAEKEYSWEDWKIPASRAEVAHWLYHSVPKNELKEINDIKRGSLEDVRATREYANEIYALLRAGVFSGSSDNTFEPDAQITRAQAAIVIDNLMNEALRKKQ